MSPAKDFTIYILKSFEGLLHCYLVWAAAGAVAAFSLPRVWVVFMAAFISRLVCLLLPHFLCLLLSISQVKLDPQPRFQASRPPSLLQVLQSSH